MADEKKFLDSTGLTHLWEKIKTVFMSKPTAGTKDQVLTLNEDGTYAWANAKGGIADATSDNKIYGRKNATWVEVPECSCDALTNDEIDDAINNAK